MSSTPRNSHQSTATGPGGGTSPTPQSVVNIPTAVYLLDSNTGSRRLLSSSSSAAAAAAAAPLLLDDGSTWTPPPPRSRRKEAAADNGGGLGGSCYSNSNNSTGNGGEALLCPPVQQQQQCVDIVLDEQEYMLFQVLVGTVQAYEKGLLRCINDDDEHDGAAATTSTTNTNTTERNNNSNTNHQQHQQRVTVRVAGGWVRDKILGKQSHDVDVAIDCMTGVQFARLVQRYVLDIMQSQQQQQQGHDSSSSATTTASTASGGAQLLSASRRIGVIAARPEQSKHLETATMKLCGLDVDFLNLRGQEQYDTTSRIPITSFGTPIEDAERRDFTMNSLFFNLRTQSIEDFLMRGLADLRKGILVTPLDALQTFHDDPLRVLRAIRFAVRYNFRLDDNIRHAAVHPDIHKAIHVKISRERVGKELEGMLSGKMADPIQALRTVSDLQLAGSVFCLPLPGVNSVGSVSGTICGHPFNYERTQDADSESARHVRRLGWQEARQCLDVLPHVMGPFVEEEEKLMRATHESLGQPTDITRIDRRLLPVAVFVLPFRTLTYRHAVKQTQKDVNAVVHIMREGLKFKNVDCTVMTLLMESVDDMAAFLRRRKRSVHTNPQSVDVPSFRLEVGMMLRQLKDSWVTCLLLATVVLLRESQRAQQGDGGTANPSTSSREEQDDWLHTALDVYRDIIVVHKLDRSWLIRPLLDGSSIAATLQLPKGPLVARYLKEQVHWMLLHPDGTRDACEAHLSLLHKRRSQDEVPSNRSGHEDDANDEHLGASDGTGKTPSSPVLGGRQPSDRHFSKKIHVDSMDLS